MWLHIMKCDVMFVSQSFHCSNVFSFLGFPSSHLTTLQILTSEVLPSSVFFIYFICCFPSLHCYRLLLLLIFLLLPLLLIFLSLSSPSSRLQLCQIDVTDQEMKACGCRPTKVKRLVVVLTCWKSKQKIICVSSKNNCCLPALALTIILPLGCFS